MDFVWVRSIKFPVLIHSKIITIIFKVIALLFARLGINLKHIFFILFYFILVFGTIDNAVPILVKVFLLNLIFFSTVCCKQILLLLWDDELEPLKLSKSTHLSRITTWFVHDKALHLQPQWFNWFYTEDIIKLHHSDPAGPNQTNTSISNQGSVSLFLSLSVQ